ncbi:putative HTH-type transcriptional regulator YybR [Pedobacter sp. Bi27]|jgi:DNA-binding HxlR family transcriptional regulator|uniref:winged helix-turn-helix transcriptional regulator n=1 Tax=unclassified Pedobacter TaxID=2628915 RepID=UPI001D74A80C|nr:MULTISPECIES: helix-turn-helix domain-containing protein [unclassified Pedobacter]CAH0176867.1 putative HTH-type transcriptional regulator YybR [Pedobacter sp. Bi36]CAH0201078.1 putative HTH-type transcriptional regulator YybR [Pedobacter sp. Bi27]CAH0232740.1 putative HTH-type transcriptional regulator YybR [Pedobacter sp. Bi126]
MNEVKETSTIQLNKQTVFKLCPVTYVMEKIGSYWKPIIIFHLMSGSKRYGALKKAMPHITEKMLAQHLRQLEADGLISRVALPVIPPHVTYSLTDAGQALRPVLYAMANWAIEDGQKREEPLFKTMEQFPA